MKATFPAYPRRAAAPAARARACHVSCLVLADAYCLLSHATSMLQTCCVLIATRYCITPQHTCTQSYDSMQADINSDSDFPSLSGGPRPNPATVPASAGSWNSNAIRQPSAQQAPPQQQQQQRAPSTAPSQQSLDQSEGQRSQQPPIDRASASEEYPPLSGQINGNSDTLSNNGLTSGFGSPDSTLPRPNGQQTQLPIREPQPAFPQSAQPSVAAGQPASQHQQAPPAQNGQAPASTVKKYGDMTEQEKYGLTGLLAAFEARRQAEIGGPVDETLPAAMRNAVFMGQDLSTLGMDLDSPEPLYPTFTPFPTAGSSSQFDFHDRHTVPNFTLPSAYTVTNVPPLSNRMSAFSDGMFPSIAHHAYNATNINPRNSLLRLLPKPPRRRPRTRRNGADGARLALAQDPAPVAAKGHARVQRLVGPAHRRPGERRPRGSAARPHGRPHRARRLRLLRRHELAARAARIHTRLRAVGSAP